MLETLNVRRTRKRIGTKYLFTFPEIASIYSFIHVRCWGVATRNNRIFFREHKDTYACDIQYIQRYGGTSRRIKDFREHERVISKKLRLRKNYRELMRRD